MESGECGTVGRFRSGRMQLRSRPAKRPARSGREWLKTDVAFRPGHGYAAAMFGMLAGIFFSATPNVGDLAPDFTATDTEGESHTLSKMVKDGAVIVAFFSK